MKPKRASRKARIGVALYEAEALGLVQGAPLVDISGRVPRKLVAAAKQKAGVRSDQELRLIALSIVAGHDDFGERLLRRKGSVDPSISLEF
jgi:hypothetical protein